jgi:hypothetical protein
MAYHAMRVKCEVEVKAELYEHSSGKAEPEYPLAKASRSSVRSGLQEIP